MKEEHKNMLIFFFYPPFTAFFGGILYIMGVPFIREIVLGYLYLFASIIPIMIVANIIHVIWKSFTGAPSTTPKHRSEREYSDRYTDEHSYDPPEGGE